MVGFVGSVAFVDAAVIVLNLLNIESCVLLLKYCDGGETGKRTREIRDYLIIELMNVIWFFGGKMIYKHTAH